MFRNHRFLILILFAGTGALSCPGTWAAEMSEADAWKALPQYQYGQDMAPLLTLDRVVIQAMRAPATRAACAKRLATLLTLERTSLPARQYICLQLRQIGTPAEVPVLARLLAQPETTEMARYALESIPGTASGAVLRDALATRKGKPLIGLINSVAARRDAAAVLALQRLSTSSDKHVAAAALWALGNIASESATAYLLQRAERTKDPVPQELAVPLLRCADAMRRNGKADEAEKLLVKLSVPGQLAAVRRAALGGLLRLQGDDAAQTIVHWLSDADAARRRVAVAHLHALSDKQLDQLIARLSTLPPATQLAVVDLGAARRGTKLLPLARSLMQSDNVDLKLAGIRCLGLIGDASTTGVLIETLAAGGDVTAAAQEALVSRPAKEVVPVLIETLRNRPALRGQVIPVLVKLKSYDAIDPLIDIAAATDPAEYVPALDGLRGIADPDKTDIPRLIKLLLRTERGKHRDEVEKTILIVCDKLPAGADRAKLVLASLAGIDRAEAPKYLPLLGRLGGAKALAVIQTSMRDNDPAMREAAIRALCNWPNAEVADRLLELAKTSANRTHRRWALRAYIRVITLKSDRPEEQTLAMLQNAMKLAEGADEKRLVLERAATVRTMDTVNWIAPYLDDPELAQTACVAICDLAHHRFLRHPNLDRFGPLLDKVAHISKDPAIVERAKRYRLGL